MKKAAGFAISGILFSARRAAVIIDMAAIEQNVTRVLKFISSKIFIVWFSLSAAWWFTSYAALLILNASPSRSLMHSMA